MTVFVSFEMLSDGHCRRGLLEGGSKEKRGGRKFYSNCSKVGRGVPDYKNP
ncbi:MAG: hypothetical protein RBR95_00290 [Ignavibacteriaceae bacterium]|nr:hypothetical protein [Ignavibacteriaceae bacterium]